MSVGVFLSYAHVDASVCREIQRMLASEGVSYFVDEKGIEVGDKLTDRIKRGISECDVVVVILSASSVKSPWVSFEVGFAVALDKVVVPFLSEYWLQWLQFPSFLEDRKYTCSIDELRIFLTKVRHKERSDSQHQISQLEIADVRFDEGEQLLDVFVTNKSAHVAFLKSARVHVHKIWRFMATFAECVTFSRTATYHLVLPVTSTPFKIDTPLSQAIRPNDIDQFGFSFLVKSDGLRPMYGETSDYVFHLSIEIVYDAQSKLLMTPDILYGELAPTHQSLLEHDETGAPVSGPSEFISALATHTGPKNVACDKIASILERWEP